MGKVTCDNDDGHMAFTGTQAIKMNGGLELPLANKSFSIGVTHTYTQLSTTANNDKGRRRTFSLFVDRVDLVALFSFLFFVRCGCSGARFRAARAKSSR